MYLALKQKSSIRILDIKIFKPIKGSKKWSNFSVILGHLKLTGYI